MDYGQVLKELYAIELKGFDLGLERMNLLLRKLGNPEKNLKYIHVAGTNGKGSVCAMLYSVLRKSGYKAGMYTSPHLVRLNERIQFDGKEISEEDVVRYYLRVKAHVSNQTFFEIITAMAFLYFQDMKPDIVVLEVGMGGRLDATNVVTPLVSVITNITLEHTQHLGNTLSAIAGEKAGIIKKGIPIVTAAKGKALDVIKQVVKEKNAKLHIIIKPANKNIELGLKGNYQRENLAVVLKTIELLNGLGFEIWDIPEGLRTAEWPGRFQLLEDNLLLDCAHNPDGMKALVTEFKRLDAHNIILVFGVCKDKDMKEIVRQIEPFADIIILSKAHIPRACPPSELAKLFTKQVKIIADVKEAVAYAKSIAGPEDFIVLTGSIYLVGEYLS